MLKRDCESRAEQEQNQLMKTHFLGLQYVLILQPKREKLPADVVHNIFLFLLRLSFLR